MGEREGGREGKRSGDFMLGKWLPCEGDPFSRKEHLNLASQSQTRMIIVPMVKLITLSVTRIIPTYFTSFPSLPSSLPTPAL